MRKAEELLTNARDICVEILTKQEVNNVTSSNLETLFQAYGLCDSIQNTKDNIARTLIDAMRITIDEYVIPYFTDLIKKSDSGFIDILIKDILNGESSLQQIINDPYNSLPDNIKTNDSKIKSTINNLLKQKINENLSTSANTFSFESQELSELQKIIQGINNITYLEPNTKNVIASRISNVLINKTTPELQKILDNFGQEINKAIKNSDSTFNAGDYKNEFIETVRELENNEIVRGSSAETNLLERKSRFETTFDQSVSDLIKNIINGKFSEELEKLDNEREIDGYIRYNENTKFANINKLINEIFKSEVKSSLEKLRDDKITEARLACKSKPPKVRITTDELGNQYARFGNENFPVAHREKTNYIWRIEPRKDDGNIVITYKNRDQTIEPSAGQRSRADEPYEMSPDKYKRLDKNIKKSKILSMKINKKSKELETTTDEAEKDRLQKEISSLERELKRKEPHIEKVRKKLKLFDQLKQNYINSKVPDFDPDTIKITPDIMENLREIAECSKTMLTSGKDGFIIEGEAGVGKNVLIDIFAHFTNRPVFVFACNKKTDNHDLTYQWILDALGSKKAHSKVWEAIRTPGAILVFDEINTLDDGIIKGLNGLFDKRKTLVAPEAGDGDTKALPDVLLFGTMNPTTYAGTKELPPDVASRFHFIKHDYDWLFKKDGGVSYSDALRTYGNVNYFWKLLTGNGRKKQDTELYEEAILDKKLGHKLSPKKKDILKKFKPISDVDFIWAWNQLFNTKNKREVINKFGDKFEEGMNDIYTIVLYSNYIRMRHRLCASDIDTTKFPWNNDTNELFDEKSFSPRLAIQALEQLNNGNEIHSAKEAVIQTYIHQISNEEKRRKIVQLFNSLSINDIISHLKNDAVENILFDAES